MLSLFYKTLRWYIIVALGIGGFYFMSLATGGEDMKPLMPMGLCFAIAYVLAYFWHRYKRQVVFTSLGAFVLTAALAYGLPFLLYVFADILLDASFYLMWLGAAALIGAPIMMFAISRYD